MTTITVPAAEVQPGDTFSIAGNTVTVTDVRPHPLLSTLVKLHHTNLRCVGGHPSTFVVVKDVPLVVDRVDPGADLIESMAAARFSAGAPVGTCWDDLSELSKDRHRVRAEAALAVAKRLGAL